MSQKKKKRIVEEPPAWFVKIVPTRDGRFACKWAEQPNTVFATGDTELEAYRNFIKRYPEL